MDNSEDLDNNSPVTGDTPSQSTEHHSSDGTSTSRSPSLRNSEGVKLNLILCGSDRTLKTSISNLILDQRDETSELSSECVRREGEVCGRLISLVEFPSLVNTHLSEEEVMRQTLRCVTLCDPGVHVFLFVIPDGDIKDEDKAEIEEIRRIFSSRINKQIMVLRITETNMSAKIHPLDSSATEAKTSLQTFGDQCFVLESSSQVPALLQDVENVVKQNRGRCYTTFMYLQAQIELERNKHRTETEKLRRDVTHSDDGLRIVLLGKTGVGKSATANTILRKKAFTSKLTSRSVTRECQKETTEFDRGRITAIDTPGLFDTGVDNVETRKEIVKCISMAAPGPHVFLLVIPLGRFTQEEKDAVKMIQEMFGDKSRMYTMVLFTRGDDLGETTIEEFIKADDSLQYLVLQCGKRYHVFNNKTEDQTQVTELLNKIECLVTANEGSFYTSEMFQQVEKNIREEQERIMKEKEEEIKRNEEKLKTRYEAEIKHMKKENEREREQMQTELRKSAEEFKKKEDEIKKEKDDNLRKEMQKKLEEQQKIFEEERKRQEKVLGEQQQNTLKYLTEQHEREKEKLQKKLQRETREKAEREFREKLDREMAKAADVPYRSKRAADWGYYVPVLGAAAGGAVGSVEDLAHWIRGWF